MADKPVLIFNNSLTALETPHLGDTVVVSQPTRFDGPVTLGGVARTDWGNTILSGIAAAGSATTLTLQASVVATAGAFVGMLLRIDAGACVGRNDIIVSHTVGASPVLTVATGTIMDNTSQFSIFATGSNSASQTPFTPVGNVAATDVQAAVAELDTEKVDVAANTAAMALKADTAAMALKANTSTVNASLALKADTSTVNASLALKANLVSPALTVVPTAPTAAVGTNTTQLATTAFVQASTPAFRGAFVYQSASIALAKNVWSLLTFNFEVYDTDAIHAANSANLVVPAGVTKVKLSAQVSITGTPPGDLFLVLYKNSSSVLPVVGSSGRMTSNIAYYINLSTPVLLVTAGDTFSLQIFISSVNNLNTFNNGVWFAMEIIK